MGKCIRCSEPSCRWQKTPSAANGKDFRREIQEQFGWGYQSVDKLRKSVIALRSIPAFVLKNEQKPE